MILKGTFRNGHFTPSNHKFYYFWARRNGRVVECGGLENRCPFTRTGGSNPSSSANHYKPDRKVGFFVGSER